MKEILGRNIGVGWWEFEIIHRVSKHMNIFQSVNVKYTETQWMEI